MTYVTVQAHHKLSNVIARLCSTTAQLSMCYSKQQNSSTWQAAWCLIVLSIRAHCPFMPISSCPMRTPYSMTSCLSVYCYDTIADCPCLWHVTHCHSWVLVHLNLRITWGCPIVSVRFLCSDLNALFKQHIFGLSPHRRITRATCFLQLLSDDVSVPAVMQRQLACCSDTLMQ